MDNLLFRSWEGVAVSSEGTITDMVNSRFVPISMTKITMRTTFHLSQSNGKEENIAVITNI